MGRFWPVSYSLLTSDLVYQMALESTVGVDIFSLKLQRSLHKVSWDCTAIFGEAECIAGDMISAKSFRCTLTYEFTELAS